MREAYLCHVFEWFKSFKDGLKVKGDISQDVHEHKRSEKIISKTDEIFCHDSRHHDPQIVDGANRKKKCMQTS